MCHTKDPTPKEGRMPLVTQNVKYTVRTNIASEKSLASSSNFFHWRFVRRKIACMDIRNVKCTGQTFSRAKSREWKASLTCPAFAFRGNWTAGRSTDLVTVGKHEHFTLRNQTLRLPRHGAYTTPGGGGVHPKCPGDRAIPVAAKLCLTRARYI